ncbi:arsenic resistance protein [Roseovarius tibetensis]|uniref:arsenic resistance protein n=1 Tax=Roseovarius tibetensis TaxID=2685897 RepID=UPI003D7F31B2
MLVIAAMFASRGRVLLDNPGVILLIIGPGAAFFVVIFIVTLGVSRMANLTYPQTALMVFTTPVRNSEVSPAVAVTAFTSPLIALTVVIGPAIELPVLIVMLNILKQLRTRWDATGS